MASSLIYNMIDVSAVNAYVMWQQSHAKNNRIFSKKRRKFLIRLGKELAGMSSALSMQKGVQFSLKAPEKGLLQPKTRQQTQKKAMCYLCGRSKDRKCRQACSACNTNICQEHSQVICMQCNQ